MNRWIGWSCLGLILTGLTVLCGCAATGSARGDAETPLPGGGRVGLTFRVGPEGGTVKATGVSVCIEICFSNAAGADLGCIRIGVPGAGQVPAGAVRFEAWLIDCPEDRKSLARDASGSGGRGGLATGAPLQDVEVGGVSRVQSFVCFGGPVIPSMEELNLSYAVAIDAKSLGEAQARLALLLAGGIGSDAGDGVLVHYFAETRAQLGPLGLPTGVLVRQASYRDAFSHWRMDLNGNVGYAELGATPGLSRYGLGAWDVLELFVPSDDFDTTMHFRNEATAEWALDADPTEVIAASQAVAHD